MQSLVKIRFNQSGAPNVNKPLIPTSKQDTHLMFKGLGCMRTDVRGCFLNT